VGQDESPELVDNGEGLSHEDCRYAADSGHEFMNDTATAL
jgi:hypothetical protein